VCCILGISIFSALPMDIMLPRLLDLGFYFRPCR
jgi:hypothetical protein